MQKCFQGLFINPSEGKKYEVKNGAYFFGSEQEGDQFRDEDIALWTTGGHFKRVWENRGKRDNFFNDVHYALTDEAAALNLPVMEIACGPNLGLLPHIISKNNNLPCLATDACPAVITNWQQYFLDNQINSNISFASFNAADMPLRSDSVDVITSNIGLSSLRYAGDDNMLGVREAYRVLKPGGFVFALENEYEDYALVDTVFKHWGKVNWYRNNKMTWAERFRTAGFEIVYEKRHSKMELRADDMDLGEAAAKCGITLNLINTVYKLRKNGSRL